MGEKRGVSEKQKKKERASTKTKQCSVVPLIRKKKQKTDSNWVNLERVLVSPWSPGQPWPVMGHPLGEEGDRCALA